MKSKMKKTIREVAKQLDEQAARSVRLRKRLDGDAERPVRARSNGRDERPSSPDLVAEPT